MLQLPHFSAGAALGHILCCLSELLSKTISQLLIIITDSCHWLPSLPCPLCYPPVIPLSGSASGGTQPKTVGNANGRRNRLSGWASGMESITSQTAASTTLLVLSAVG